MHPGAAGSAPSGDWMPRRVGADPPAAEVELLTTASAEVYAACGVPVALFATGEGTAQRESFRRLLHATVQPLARIVSAELSAKMDADVALSFDTLFAADLSGRARAFQSLVKAGMDLSKAAGLAGLDGERWRLIMRVVWNGVADRTRRRAPERLQHPRVAWP